MVFEDSYLQVALEQWRANGDVKERACADNIWFEERVSAKRKAAFEDAVRGVDTAAGLAKGQIDYRAEFVWVDEDVPHTFLQALEPADLAPLDEGQWIVRLEGLTRPLEKSGISFAELEGAVLKKHEPSAGALLDSFLRTWNTSSLRDWRPAFAVFHDEVKEDLEKTNWPNRLRDRLGLAHYSSLDPIPVALMKYTVRDVIAAYKAPAHCFFTAPTVFDNGPWPYFFPAPENIYAGRSMALFAVADDKDLLSEILHSGSIIDAITFSRLDKSRNFPQIIPYDHCAIIILQPCDWRVTGSILRKRLFEWRQSTRYPRLGGIRGSKRLSRDR